MKISKKPTDHILVRANCQSQWDCCDFAIIACGESWKELMRKRLEATVSFFADYDFKYFSYRDDSAEFYTSNGDEIKNLFTETGGKEWIFVTLDEGEEESFSRPENRLESYSLNLYRDGSGLYKANGKNSGEEFYTAELPLAKIMEYVRTNGESSNDRDPENKEAAFISLGITIYNSVMAYMIREQTNNGREETPCGSEK